MPDTQASDASAIIKVRGLSKVVPLPGRAGAGASPSSSSNPQSATAPSTASSADGSRLVILQDIEFEVRAGESLAIVGASGSGKSTLLGLLAGLDVPSAGTVQLEGQQLFDLNEDGRAALRARLVGFVFQSFQLLPALDALDNVMLPLELTGEPRAAELAEAMLSRVGLAERLRHYPKQLSGGEQQRVALARAFVVQPKLLFADEPTGNLDAATGSAIIDLLFKLNAENGTTLVLVTHDEALARRCHRSIRLAGGEMLGTAAAKDSTKDSAKDPAARLLSASVAS